MPMNLPVLEDDDLNAYLAQMDIQSILEETFAALAKGSAVQPPQNLTVFPDGRGDFITYQGAIGDFDAFGAKLSPYIPTGGAPIVTAWTLLMSMRTGRPLLLCDSARLTTERTAATTALAVNKLALKEARTLAVIGSGRLAQAHLKQVLGLRSWEEIRVFSPGLGDSIARQELFKKLDPRVLVAPGAKQCVSGADVVLLATSSGTPVINVADIGGNALICSISTNAPKAHEIDPALLPDLDVYCDYRATTPESAGEMLLAAESGSWSREQIKGDLPELCVGAAPLPDYSRPVFFRSIGLGLEDVAVAYAVYQKLIGN